MFDNFISLCFDHAFNMLNPRFITIEPSTLFNAPPIPLGRQLTSMVIR
jgi:hypothetical protein